jgi:hypothetical protein
MNPYVLSLLARIHHEERLAKAEATRRLRPAKRTQRPGAPVDPGTQAPAIAPVCSTA